MSPARVPLEDRFWTKVNKTESCWLWTAATNSAGYGQIGVERKATYAHRISYEWAKGPIPPGCHLDHLCRTPLCVNPDHLEAVTPGENVRRGMAPSAVAVRENICPRGHEFTDSNTHVRRNGKRACRACQKLRDDKHKTPTDVLILSRPITTGEAAQIAYVNPQTVRRWASRALLVAVDRDQHGWPLYNALDVLRVERETRRRERALLLARRAERASA